jgi:hypothetical protein
MFNDLRGEFLAYMRDALKVIGRCGVDIDNARGRGHVRCRALKSCGHPAMTSKREYTLSEDQDRYRGLYFRRDTDRAQTRYTPETSTEAVQRKFASTNSKVIYSQCLRAKKEGHIQRIRPSE